MIAKKYAPEAQAKGEVVLLGDVQRYVSVFWCTQGARAGAGDCQPCRLSKLGVTHVKIAIHSNTAAPNHHSNQQSGQSLLRCLFP